MEVNVSANVATVTIPPKTLTFITLMSAGLWQERVEVQVGDGSSTAYTSGGPTRNACLKATHIPQSTTSQTVKLSFFQNTPTSGWQPSNQVVALQSLEGNLESCFLAGRDDGGASSLDAFPNSSALVYFHKGYSY